MKTPTSTNNLIEIFVGVDIGKSFHCAAAINPRGNVLLKPVKVLASAEGLLPLKGLRQLGDKTAVLIGLEASGHYWMSVSAQAKSTIREGQDLRYCRDGKRQGNDRKASAAF